MQSNFHRFHIDGQTLIMDDIYLMRNVIQPAIIMKIVKLSMIKEALSLCFHVKAWQTILFIFEFHEFFEGTPGHTRSALNPKINTEGETDVG